MSATSPDHPIHGLVSAVRADGATRPVLETLWRARADGIELDDAALGALARAYERDPDDLRRLADFASRSLSGGGESLRVCLGLNCRSKGSPDLHARLFRRLPDGLVVEERHCLDNCDRGPSLAVGGLIYSGHDETVREDERGWRRV